MGQTKGANYQRPRKGLSVNQGVSRLQRRAKLCLFSCDLKQVPANVQILGIRELNNLFMPESKICA